MHLRRKLGYIYEGGSEIFPLRSIKIIFRAEFLILLLSIFFLAGFSPAAHTAISDGTVELEFSLENGLRVYLLSQPRFSLAAAVLAVKAGVVNETPETSGLLHLLEHCLLFRQTHLLQENRLFNLLAEYGIHYNAFTEQDLMMFEISLPGEFLEKGLELLKEVVFNFNLTQEELEKEKEVLLKELADVARRPEKVGLAKVYELAFPDSGYGLPVYGNEAVVRKTELRSLQDFHRKLFRTDRAALAVAGNFKPEETAEKIKKLFSELMPPAERQPEHPLRAKFATHGPEVHLKMKISETYVMVGFPAPEYSSADRVAMDMLSEILGQGLNPLLFQAFSGQPDLITSARFHYLAHEGAGLALISLTTEEDKVPAARRALVNFLPKLAEINYSSKDYLPSQQFLVFDYLQGGKNRFRWLSERMMESPLTLAASLARHLLLRDRNFQVDYLKAIDRLSSSDLRKTARKYFSGVKPVWVIVKPEEK
ncbi:MAG: insulinase family protein [Candidatus Saccharicenans sp.]